jgi:hypothetical protein
LSQSKAKSTAAVSTTASRIRGETEAPPVWVLPQLGQTLSPVNISAPH